MDTPIISILGNIGSGKTTFANGLIKDENGYKFHQEPLHIWKNVNSHNLLKLFYDKPKKYSLSFQITVLGSFKQMFSNIRRTEDVSTSINFVERSHLDGLEVFGPTLVEGDLMSNVEYETLRFLATCVLNENDNVDGFIYLKTDPELCFKRVMLRNRYEESPLCIEYIRTLHNKYEKWMSNVNSADVLVIDNNVDKTSKQYLSNKKLVDEFCERVCANKNKITQQ